MRRIAIPFKERVEPETSIFAKLTTNFGANTADPR